MSAWFTSERVAAPVRDAHAFAAAAHAGQLRKYVGTPYIEHPVAVARLLARFTHDDAMIMAALLQDVIEDCGVRRSELVLRFGGDVANLVDELTDVTTLGPEGPSFS